MTPGRLHRWRWIAAILLCCGCEARPLDPPPPADATSPGSTATTSAPPPKPAPHALDRLVLVGASGTDGFGAEVRMMTPEGRSRYASVELADVLDATIDRDHRGVAGHGSAFFFTAPMRMGPRLLEKALAEHPTLLVAIDFLFWFAYGINGPDGLPFASDAQRIELLEVGLALLEEVDCPVLLGDLPDVSPAIGIMLSARQVPSPETLAVLNARIREWASERPNVVVVPVAETIDHIQRDEAFEVGEHAWPAGSASVLVQYDHLHPTSDGLVVTAQLVALSIIESGQADTGDFLLDPDAVLDRVRERERAMMQQ